MHILLFASNIRLTVIIWAISVLKSSINHCTNVNFVDFILLITCFEQIKVIKRKQLV